MIPDNAALLKMLQAKAMLLLRREKEVFELRLDRSRNRAWLNVFHKASIDLRGKTSDALFDVWAAAMVDDLNFQVAAVYRRDTGAAAMTLVCDRAHAPLARSIAFDAQTWERLMAAGGASFQEGQPALMKPVAAEVGLSKFLWSCVATRESQFLLLAGFAAQAGVFHTLSEDDLEHYILFGAHVTALLDMIHLIAERDGERSELRHSNAQLDASLTELRETQARLVQSSKVLAEVSRRAGMAEVATGILHNVGNALNSVNVSAELTARRLAALKLVNLGRIADLLDRGPAELSAYLCEDAQGKTLPAFLKRLAANLAGERDEISAEVRALQQHVEHIKWIISKQQAYAKTMGVIEPCLAAQLMDDAIGIAGDSLAQRHIEVVKEYQPLAGMALDKHKVLQILVNLLSNAQHALTASGRAEKRIVARVAQPAEGRLRLELADNGVGISEAHLDKLFTHGFTTRQHGHGFGLHTSALAASEMGGTLTCSSPGPGCGATFTLEVPAPPARMDDAHPASTNGARRLETP